MKSVFILIFLFLNFVAISQELVGCVNEDFSEGFKNWTFGHVNLATGRVSGKKGVQAITQNYTYLLTTTKPNPDNGYAPRNQVLKERFEIFNINDYIINGEFYPIQDVYGEFEIFRKNENGEYSNTVVKLGNDNAGANSEQLIYEFIVTPDKPYFIYHFAYVMEKPTHLNYEQPFFEVKMYDMSRLPNLEINCSKNIYIAGDDLESEGKFDNNIKDNNDFGLFKDWTSNFIDLKDYINKKVKIIFTTADCSHQGHFAYAYLDAECLNGSIFLSDGKACVGEQLQLSAVGTGIFKNESYEWDLGDGTISNLKSVNHTYDSKGKYNIKLTVTATASTGCGIRIIKYDNFEIGSCAVFDCDECIPSFSPQPGKYTISAWVKEENINVKTYNNATIFIELENANNIGPIRANGQIIDGWQRIEQDFVIPESAKAINVKLMNLGSDDVYFDDIRIQPFNSNMKSFVYNPTTLRLEAELDENNYATFYEYDEEGALVRVKKETERGVKTINETRQNLSKPVQD